MATIGTDRPAWTIVPASAAERDDQDMGCPLVYRPTPRLLRLLGVETLDEARAKLRPAG